MLYAVVYVKFYLGESHLSFRFLLSIHFFSLSLKLWCSLLSFWKKNTNKKNRLQAGQAQVCEQVRIFLQHEIETVVGQEKHQTSEVVVEMSELSSETFQKVLRQSVSQSIHQKTIF